MVKTTVRPVPVVGHYSTTHSDVSECSVCKDVGMSKDRHGASFIVNASNVMSVSL